MGRSKIKKVLRNTGVEIFDLAVERRLDPDLHVDYCHIPAQKTFERLFILVSGVNGIEGYAGSAIQQMFLREIVRETGLEEYPKTPAREDHPQ